MNRDLWVLAARLKAIEILQIEELVRWCRSQTDPLAFAKKHGKTLQKRTEGMTMSGIAEGARADAFAQETQERVEAIWAQVTEKVRQKAKPERR